MNRAAQLDALIDELTVDADNDEEQLGGLLVGADAAMRRGERATLVGMKVEVLAVDCGPDARTGLLARVRNGEATHEVSLADLPLRSWQRARAGGGRLPEMAGAVTSNPETLVVLAALTDREKAEVLDSLIAQDPTVCGSRRGRRPRRARGGRDRRGRECSCRRASWT